MNALYKKYKNAIETKAIKVYLLFLIIFKLLLFLLIKWLLIGERQKSLTQDSSLASSKFPFIEAAENISEFFILNV